MQVLAKIANCKDKYCYRCCLQGRSYNISRHIQIGCNFASVRSAFVHFLLNIGMETWVCVRGCMGEKVGRGYGEHRGEQCGAPTWLVVAPPFSSWNPVQDESAAAPHTAALKKTAGSSARGGCAAAMPRRAGQLPTTDAQVLRGHQVPLQAPSHV